MIYRYAWISKSPEKYTYSGQLRSELAQLWRKKPSRRGAISRNKKKPLKICPASSTAKVGLRIPDWLKEVRWPPGEVRTVPPWRWGWQYKVSVTVRRYMPWDVLITDSLLAHMPLLYNTESTPLASCSSQTDARDAAPAPRWKIQIKKCKITSAALNVLEHHRESLGVTIFLDVFLLFLCFLVQ